MPLLLEQPLPKADWHHEADASLSHARAASGANGANGRGAAETEHWRAMLAAVDRLRDLGDDWDGAGAERPSAELVDSARGLALVFQGRNLPAPSRVVASPEGSVILEWQFDDGTYAEVDVVRPFYAEVLWVAPGQPAKHWTLPTDE
jgi:hypothetical protein